MLSLIRVCEGGCTARLTTLSRECTKETGKRRRQSVKMSRETGDTAPHEPGPAARCQGEEGVVNGTHGGALSERVKGDTRYICPPIRSRLVYPQLLWTTCASSGKDNDQDDGHKT